MDKKGILLVLTYYMFIRCINHLSYFMYYFLLLLGIFSPIANNIYYYLHINIRGILALVKSQK